ncbi:hypothetical protein GCM10027081_30920 [Cupriavidus yeoncheonensis]
MPQAAASNGITQAGTDFGGSIGCVPDAVAPPVADWTVMAIFNWAAAGAGSGTSRARSKWRRRNLCIRGAGAGSVQWPAG